MCIRDRDYCYVDFPAKIKAAGLNGYAKGSSTPAPVKKSNEEIASEVIAGKWGNGAERQKLLSQAGYDYSAIQGIVNKKLSHSENQWMRSQGRSSGASGEMVLTERKGSLLPDMIIPQYRKG